MDYLLADWIKVPTISTQQMREVDRLMIEEFNVQLLQMMENAGGNLAELARRLLGGSVASKLITVAVGKGNNGAGGQVAARHLSNWGAKVTLLAESESFSKTAQAQWTTLQQLPIENRFGSSASDTLEERRPHLIIDALIGYSLAGNLGGWSAHIIECINQLDCPTLALDLPSGLDGTTGEVHEPCVNATSTMTLALPKIGLTSKQAGNVIGTLYLADIGVPPALYEKLGILAKPIFVRDTIIKLEPVKAS
ncbi:MAG TPA: NAD(P)H-hydrate epimerase [Actinobacteria bacterium]|nr:NAD(P)H-hydrate epimerase [Actinomycetota bacterium]